jgi:hypothetical protein
LFGEQVGEGRREGFVVSGSTEPVESLWVERLAEVSAERLG